MGLTLEIFAPHDACHSYSDQKSRKDFTDCLLENGWTDTQKSFPMLAFHERFWKNHASVHMDLTGRMRDDLDEASHLTGGARVERLEAWAQSTGECLVSCTYAIADAPDDVAFEAYYRLTEPTRSHFYILFMKAKSQLERLLNVLPKPPRHGLSRPRPISSGPHWTHGIYMHVGDGPPLATQQLQLLAGLHGVEPEVLQYQHKIVRHVPGPSGEPDVSSVQDVRTLACFGWETSAVSTNDADESRAIAGLVKLMGYIWELHWSVNALATDKTQELVEGQPSSLDIVTRFRNDTAAVLSVCSEANLTMTGRFVHMVRQITRQWNFAELRASIGANTELFALIAQGIEEKRVERRNRLIGTFAAVLTGLTVVSVVNDFGTFVHGHDKMQWGDLLYPFTHGWWLPSAVVIIAPPAIIVIIVVVLLRWHQRSGDSGERLAR